MERKIFKPHPALQELVSSIVVFRADLRHIRDTVICPFPPTPQNYIYFYINDPIYAQKNGDDFFVKKADSITVGPQITRVSLNLGKDHCMIGIIFHPGGLYRLLGMPMGKIVDEDIDTYSLLGKEIRIVYEKLKDSKSWLDMKNIAESFLMQKLDKLKAALPFDYAIRELMKHNGNLSIEKVAYFSCLSIRQFERKCIERIGLSPKIFARLIRFSGAYHLKEAQHHLSWTHIAHFCGYYDQMHFLKDFREFAGVTPSLIQKELEATPLRLQGNIQ